VRDALQMCRCGGVDVDAVEAIVSNMSTPTDSLAALVIPAGTTGPVLRVHGTVDDLARALAARTTPSSPVRLRFH